MIGREEGSQEQRASGAMKRPQNTNRKEKKKIKFGKAIEEDMHVTAKQISMCGNRW